MTQSSSCLYEWLIQSVHRMEVTDMEPVSKWLEDLRLMTEMECVCVLQGKSLSQDTTDLVFTTAKTAKDSIEVIKGRAHVISAQFSKLFRKLEKQRWKQVHSGALRVTCQIRSLLHDCNSSLPATTPTFIQEQQRVMQGCAKLAQYVESHQESDGKEPQKGALLQLLTSLGQAFSSLVDLALSALVQSMIESLEKAESPYSIKAGINNLVSLGTEGEHMCYLIAKCGGVKALVAICRQESMQFAHAQALRALATVCCVPESFTELEQVGGVECLSDILGDMSCPESVRCEAAGVVAQITSPCMEHYQHLGGFLENMDDLIKALTVLSEEASCHEVLLLSAAALANITFMDSLACDYLLQYHTAPILIAACHHNKAQTIFAKDQVATVLANMAALEICCKEITDNSGLELLVQFLHESMPKFATEAEASACERVQQKAAIALSRLSRDPLTAYTMVDLQATVRLVQLCREPHLRNHSDAVLVACLAALRKISNLCGLEDFNKGDIRQLIQPRLMDSFLICSGMEESFV